MKVLQKYISQVYKEIREVIVLEVNGFLKATGIASLLVFLKRKVLFKSTSTARLTFRATLAVFAMWTVFLIIINRNEASISDYFLVTQNAETLRYILSSGFQGLAAIFALSISASLMIIQLSAAVYSPRLLYDFIKSKTFLFGSFLYITALSSNFLLLSLINGENLINYPVLIFANNLLTIAAVIFIFPLILSFLRGADPMAVGFKLVNRFDKDFFDIVRQAQGYSGRVNDDRLPVLQTLIIKSIQNGDSDLALRLLGSFGEQTAKNINEENALSISRYSKSFFRKIITAAFQYDEEEVLLYVINVNEELQEKCTELSYLSHHDLRFDGISFANNISYVGMNAVKRGEAELIRKAGASLNRLGRIFIPLIPKDDEIAGFRFRKYMRDKDETYKDEPEDRVAHYANERMFEFIRDTFVLASFLGLANEDLYRNSGRNTHNLIRDIVWSRYELDKLSSQTHKEVKVDIWFSIIFALEGLLQNARKLKINVTQEIVHVGEEVIEEMLEIEVRLAKHMVSLVNTAVRVMVMDGYLFDRPTWVFHEVGVLMRHLSSSKNKEASELLESIVDTLEEVLDFIDTPPTEGLADVSYREIKKEVLDDLKSLQKFGLPELDVELQRKVSKLINTFK